MRKTWIIVAALTSLLLVSDCAEVEVVVRGAGRFVLPPDVPQCPSLNVPRHPQDTNTWCWAASAQMVMEFHNAIERQCQIVNKVYKDDFNTAEAAAARPGELVANPRIDCCLVTAPTVLPATGVVGQPLSGDQDPNFRLSMDNCSRGGWPDLVFDNPDFRFRYSRVRHPPFETWWKQVINQICQGRPFIFAVKWVEGGYHTAVVKGYRVTDNRGLFIEIYDHFADDFFDMPYEAFMGVPRDYQHDRDWINIHRP